MRAARWMGSRLAVMILWIAPALAHHAARMGHDTTILVTLKGTVEKVSFTNPHVWIYLRVTQQDGQVSTLHVQIAPPGRLIKRGFDSSVLKFGDPVTLEVWLPSGNLTLPVEGRTLILADGRQFDVGDNWPDPEPR